MNKHVRIWRMITNKVAELLPDFEVVRTYDAVSRFRELQGNGAKKAYVVLEAKSRERLSNRRIFDVYEFLVWLVERIEEPDVTAAMDERMVYLDKLADAFSLRKFEMSDEEGILVLIADDETETLGNNPYDLNSLADSELFSVQFGVTIKHEREV